MAAIAIEEEVLSKLPQLTLDQLGHVYEELDLPEIAEAARRTKTHILRKVVGYLNSDAVCDSEDGGLGHFQMIKTYMENEGVLIKLEDEAAGNDDVNAAVSAATKAFETWAFSSKEERLKYLEALYVVYKNNIDIQF